MQEDKWDGRQPGQPFPPRDSMEVEHAARCDFPTATLQSVAEPPPSDSLRSSAERVAARASVRASLHLVLGSGAAMAGQRRRLLEELLAEERGS